MSRVSCRPSHLNFDSFHQPCLLPWRTPYCHRNTAWAGVGEDCRPRTTWRPLALFGQPGSPSFATHWRFLPRRLDGTTAGCQFILPPLRVPPQSSKGCSHTRRFGTLASPPPPVSGMPLGPHPPCHQKSFIASPASGSES